jgi:hypothetical protein
MGKEMVDPLRKSRCWYYSGAMDSEDGVRVFEEESDLRCWAGESLRVAELTRRSI